MVGGCSGEQARDMDKKWWTLVVVCAGTFMLLLDVTIVIVALPTIQSGLHASFSEVQWVVDAYALTLASVLLTAGSLADRYGRRLLFTVGLIIFTLGSLLCGVAQSPIMLILSRSAQGIGGAILFATSLALLAHSFHGHERGVAFGVWGAITGVAVALGPVLGGVITTGISWRGIFLVNLPIGVAALAITRWQVEESKTPNAARPDWAGFATLTAGLVSLVYGLIRAGEIAWSDTGVVICLALAVVFLGAFVAVERRAERPMFDLSLFRIPTFGGGLAAAFAMNGSLFAMLLYLVLYLQDDLGYSALGTGLRLLIMSGVTLVTATIAGRLSTHMPVRWLIGPGLFLVGIGLLLMTGLDGASTWTHLIPGFIVAGAGGGMVNPPLASTAVGVVTPQRSGMASGVNTTFRQIGIATGIAVYGSIFAASLHHKMYQALAGTPSLHRLLPTVVTSIQEGKAAQALQTVPEPLRGSLIAAIHASFASTLDLLFVVSAALALVGAGCALVLIRSRDFVVSHEPQPAPGPSEPVGSRA
jgi:EmrB/QacA subfamily drug resistance transporter